MKFKEDIVFLGRLESELLSKVYAAALALTFVPYFEGFGIPIIEAFNCGTPVITSNCTSMPEIAADAAILVNPFNINEIAQAMQDISTNHNLRKQLIEKGHKQKLNFSWDASAHKLWKCIEKALL